MSSYLIYLMGGLFLGWSLGGNDAANVFGTAVSKGMVRFRTAAVIASIAIIAGASATGSATSETLNSLAYVHAGAGAFIISLSAGFSVFVMTRAGLPVSTSHAIIGAIAGWSLYNELFISGHSLGAIIVSWITSPVLAALFAIITYIVSRRILERIRLHLFRADMLNRIGLVVAGAFGAWALGANNIGNVVGIFLESNPFPPLFVWGVWIPSDRILFFIGGVAIAVGVGTYSWRVMKTVGKGIAYMTPAGALVVVVATAMVLATFSSPLIAGIPQYFGLPSLPLVPVSSSQAVIGAVLGIGLLHGPGTIRYRPLGKIVAGWIVTPLLALILVFVSLFFAENVFQLPVSYSSGYEIDDEVQGELVRQGLDAQRVAAVPHGVYPTALDLLEQTGTIFSDKEKEILFTTARKVPLQCDDSVLSQAYKALLPVDVKDIITALNGDEFDHPWQVRREAERLNGGPLGKGSLVHLNYFIRMCIISGQ